MKNLVITVFIFSIFFYGVAVGAYRIFPFQEIKGIKDLVLANSNEVEDDREAFFVGAYYLHKTSFFKLHARSNYDVVFIGDSLIDGGDWYDIFPDYRIANRGIRGDTTTGVLNRMDTIVNTRAKTAFIMIGINDIDDGVSLELVVDNYIKIIELLGDNNINVVVQSTLLTDGVIRDNGLVAALNEQLLSYCEANTISFIDVNKQLSKNGRLDLQVSSDGLHLNGLGYQRWAALIAPYIHPNQAASD